ncbi:MAG: uroporphyrinogen-III C-methyltransferase [Armatimonadota bacterium]|nr:uroporphyrinogen-III C-methyltransferase [Armatimonadota bacterium]
MGKVILVGAGPGDPGLVTVRGLECIRSADVIVYDRLVNPSLLKEAKADAQLIYVGKAAGSHSTPQEQINRILIEQAQQGKTVVRLKGGDPFVFGRGGEEALALAEAGVEFEIVPGVSSAVAAPAYAGIPVTHRGLCSAFGVVAGHEDPTKPESGIKWSAIATGLDTIVFLMGVERLPQITAELVANGRSLATPVAVIRWGSTPCQRTVIGTLENIVDRVRAAGLTAPAAVVVGEVVQLRDKLRWFDKRPLFGKKILVTRSEEQAGKLCDALRQHGAEAVEFPVIKICPLANYDELDGAIREVGTFDWLLFTSANGVDATIKRLKETGRDVRSLAGPKIGAIGPATAESLERLGVRVDYVPSQFVAEAFCEDFPEDPEGKRILVIRAEQARNVLPERLAERGALVCVAPAYRTEACCPTNSLDELRNQLTEAEIDVVTFTSSSTVSAFVQLVGKDIATAMPENVKIACIGPITAGTARDLGLRVDIVAREYTTAGLVEAILDAFRESAARGDKKVSEM